MTRLVQKRKQIDPKTLRKHSKIVQDRTDPLLVVGTRERTDFGYTTTGTVHKTFETLHMAIVAGSTTPMWCHPKKSRAYRVVSGTGRYQREITEGEVVRTEDRELTPGDEVLADAGHIHRLIASTKLELYVTQDSKYTASLDEVAPVEHIADVQSSELQSLSLEEKALRRGGVLPRRSRTKAAEQIAASRGEAVRQQRAEGGNPENFFRNDVAGVNAMPVSGFSEDGAG